jgi:hypothetical protein
MTRCAHTDGNDYRARCDADATHYLHDEDHKRVRGVWCEEHARAIVTEYREKLGWEWTMEHIEEEEHDD